MGARNEQESVALDVPVHVTQTLFKLGLPTQNRHLGRTPVDESLVDLTTSPNDEVTLYQSFKTQPPSGMNSRDPTSSDSPLTSPSTIPLTNPDSLINVVGLTIQIVRQERRKYSPPLELDTLSDCSHPTLTYYGDIFFYNNYYRQ